MPVPFLRGILAGLALLDIAVSVVGVALGFLAVFDGDRQGFWAVGAGLVLTCVGLLLLSIVKVRDW